jgi:hypothetical protein
LKLIRLFILIGCVTILSGCSRSSDSLLCQIEGKPFSGLYPLIEDSTKTTKVMMVHGVAKHEPGYSSQLLDRLANEMGLNHVSEITKNIALTDPVDTTKELGNLRIRRLTNEDKSHELLFYELTWSIINDARKKILAYDMSGDYSFHRAFVNEKIKRVTNDFIPDQMLYVGEQRQDILISFSQGFCWMVSKEWDDLPVTGKQACGIAELVEAVDVMHKSHYAFISHSLGSRVVIDGLQRIARMSSNKEDERMKLISKKADRFMQEFQQLRVPIFMLANQLPMFQLTRDPPEVTGQNDAYCRAEGEHYNLRTLSETDIIAFSDPNDILSYTITSDFMDRYIDSRICYDTTNININVADVTGAFGIDYANPFDAHNGYGTNDRVIALIAHGIGNKDTSPIVTENCRILMTN